ncbi:MAG: hypothetical protein E7220_00085 [Clostridiales bacterium]|nr:hypothetical protein [Clostridiales bacterium]
METRKRIYKYDNAKALLILLVVIGHMTTDYASDSHLVRWFTLWIYTFHMPAFILLSGLVHKQYITEERASLGVKGETRLRWDKVWGFFLCAWGLKVFLQFTRTLMGQSPLWHWIAEPGIPWYLFVMAEYELLFFVMRRIDDKAKPWMVISAAFALSAVIGYFPIIGDEFCLARMINFLPIYAIGYYLDMRSFLVVLEKKAAGLVGWIVIAASLAVCYFGKWGIYGCRKWFTGRRSYEFLQDFFSNALSMGWLIRLAVWGIALILTFAILAVIPDRDLGPVTVAGQRTLQVYFWHRPVCYLFRTLHVLPSLVVMFGGTYDEALYGPKAGLAFGGSNGAMIAGFIVYLLIGLAMTGLFSLKIFEHPTTELMKLGARIGERCRRSE